MRLCPSPLFLEYQILQQIFRRKSSSVSFGTTSSEYGPIQYPAVSNQIFRTLCLYYKLITIFFTGSDLHIKVICFKLFGHKTSL